MRLLTAAARLLTCLLLAPCLALPLGAAVLTVGPGGAFSDLQSALDAALTSPEPDEIRVAAGTFPTNLRAEAVGRRVTISGGWRPGFASFDRRQRTILHGGDVAPVFSAGLYDGSALVLTRLEIALGRGAGRGGGLDVIMENSRLEVVDCVLRDNLAEATGAPAVGGGAVVELRRGAALVVRRSRVLRNTVKGYPAHAGGIAIAGGADGPGNAVTIEQTSFVDNVASAELSDTAAVGLLIDVDATRVRLFDTSFRGNRRFGTGFTAGAALLLATGGASNSEVRRLRAVDQQATAAADARQVFVVAGDSAELVFGDSEVGRSAMAGIWGAVAGEGRLRLVNLTVADNRGGYGIHLLDEGTPGGPPQMAVANSIVFGNRMALRVDGSAAAVRNLVGVNPRFVDRAAADYRLRGNSPARDAGSGNPPGGLGPLDVARRQRVRGSAVDQGANEVQ